MFMRYLKSSKLWISFLLICFVLSLLMMFSKNISELEIEKTLKKFDSKLKQDNSTSSRKLSFSFCNIPENEVKAEEGEENMKLIQVQLVTRHGDRTPLNFDLYKKFNHKIDFCDFNKKKFEQLSKIYPNQTLDELIKQLNNKDLIPYTSSKTCSSGQLTILGLAQQIHNGLILQKKYSRHEKFYKNLKNKIILISTQTQRTKQSGTGLLKAFFPNYTNSVKVRFVPTYKFCGDNCYCPYANALIDSVKLDEQYNKKSKTVQLLAKQFSLPLRTKTLIDSLIVGFHCKMLSIPCKNQCPTDKDFNTLLKLYESSEKSANELGANRNGSMLLMLPMLENIVDSINKIIHRSHKSQKFIIYSTHDLTMRPLLQSLHLPEYGWPKFASRLVFELWESPNRKLFIKILFNGKNVTNKTNFCKGRNLCEYQIFRRYVTLGILEYFSAASSKEVCERKFSKRSF